MRPNSRYQFAIATICALALEAEAVEAAFDETYDRLCRYYGKQQGDSNWCVNGRVGKHNVALCYMPEYWELLILLGDVVVSDSLNRYEFGGEHSINDTPGRPNREIRTLLNRLKELSAAVELRSKFSVYLKALSNWKKGGTIRALKISFLIRSTCCIYTSSNI
ncbi:hypothetical protein ASPNIDRAFT_135884 [Aspergillus niger ATCC 1015]|uniref:Uncharacterized protein n=1 Tax=Aspergillus niger (strain ATCC 1015 / CBS 113.46 / FGSC A1144 / LSHB Ac4 / NCTC 3858a / NRRL 328 / USDA 3528.7) TaxID=380704 RepID=G3YD22_ASPNA|nr:hypothetical protein ASPNIDRAFT_135884 [Aspergillus niger ATCC 1015]